MTTTKTSIQIKKNKAVSPLLAACIAIVSLSSPSFAVILGGVDWEYGYEGNQIGLAADANWGFFLGTTTPSSAVSHVGTDLVINTQGALDYQAFYTSTQWAPTGTVASFEVRARMDEVTGPLNLVPLLTIATSTSPGTGGIDLFLLGTGGIYSLFDTATPIFAAGAGFDPTAFTTYRVIINPTTTNYSLSINGTEVVASRNLVASPDLNVLRLGDPTNGASGTVTFDYIGFNNNAIPEPTSALLVTAAVGTLVLVRRRRRS